MHRYRHSVKVLLQTVEGLNVNQVEVEVECLAANIQLVGSFASDDSRGCSLPDVFRCVHPSSSECHVMLVM